MSDLSRGSRGEPKCPACGWHLSFEEHEGRWLGRCWNHGRPKGTGCPRAGHEVRPLSIAEREVLKIIEANGGSVMSEHLVERLGLQRSAAAMRLRNMVEAHILARHPVPPLRGGKRFEYRVLA